MLPRRLLVLFLFALGGVACTGDGEPAPETAPDEIAAGGAAVSRVIDGDSVELEIEGATVEARLVGINAPELADCQGPGARDALTSVVLGQRVEVTEFGTDRFDRLLVELVIGQDSVNAALVRSGWALALHGDERDWVADMITAADAGLGMWQVPDICEPPEETLRIAATNVDPDGPDDDVLEEEWVEIVNEGSGPVDLEGWALRDESTSNRFTFESQTLEAGQTLRLRTGCGDDTDTDVHWCSPNGVWSNRGETVLLLAPSGAVADYVFVD